MVFPISDSLTVVHVHSKLSPSLLQACFIILKRHSTYITLTIRNSVVIWNYLLTRRVNTTGFTLNTIKALDPLVFLYCQCSLKWQLSNGQYMLPDRLPDVSIIPWMWSNYVVLKSHHLFERTAALTQTAREWVFHWHGYNPALIRIYIHDE